MDDVYGAERREFIRLPVKLKINYAFFNQEGEPLSKDVMDGETANIGGRGLLMNAGLSDSSIVGDLLDRKVIIGVKIWLPDRTDCLTALSRVAWVQKIEGETGGYRLGLEFREITSETLDELFKFIIKSML